MKTCDQNLPRFAPPGGGRRILMLRPCRRPAAGWLLAGCLLAGWLLAGWLCWLAAGWLAAPKKSSNFFLTFYFNVPWELGNRMTLNPPSFYFEVPWELGNEMCVDQKIHLDPT